MIQRKRLESAPGLERQKGSAGLLSIFVLGSAVLCTALTLDAARLYWEAQELQHIADIAALDVASSSTTVFNGLLLDNENIEALRTLAQTSINRNLPNDSWNIVATVEQLGVHQSSGVRVSCTASTCPTDVTHYDALEVRVSKETCASLIVNLAALLPFGDYQPPSNGECLTPTSRLMMKKAVAKPSLFVAFSAQTSLLTLCSDDSVLLRTLLNEIAGSALCLALINNESILYEQLTLLDFRNEMLPIAMSSSAATMEELLATEISLGELADIAAAAISNPPSSHDANAIADALNTNSTLSTFSLTLGDMLEIDRTIEDSYDIRKLMATDFEFGALLETAILLAHKCQTGVDHACLADTGAIVVPATSVDLAGLVKLQELRLNIMQAPQIAIGKVGCADGSVPAASEPACTRWRTEASPAQMSLNAEFAMNLADLINVELQLNLSGIHGYAGISDAERTANTGEFNVAIGGYTELLSSDAEDNGLTIKVSILPILEEVSVIENLLNNLLGLLNLKQLVSIEPINLEITNPIVLPIKQGGQTIQWPEQTSTSIGLLSQPYTFDDISIPLSMNVRNCIINVVGIRICGAINNEEVTINLNELLPPGTDLAQTLRSSLNEHLLPLLSALGLELNPMRINILNIHTPAASLII
ncbi:MAG: hypothetical protein ACSHXZ_13540 [Gammaproteobacteria bacterium]